MSYESQRGGVSGAPDPFSVPEVQLDCDGSGGKSLPGGQGQDQPLMPVGAYARADCALDPSIFTTDHQNVNKAPGTMGAPMPVWLA